MANCPVIEPGPFLRADTAEEHPVRQQRFLRTLGIAELGELLQAATPEVRVKWLAACSSTARESLENRLANAHQAPDWINIAQRFQAHETFAG